MYILAIYISWLTANGAGQLPALIGEKARDSIPAMVAGNGPRTYRVELPVAALAYGCLKPITPAIGRLDTQIWDSRSPTVPTSGFHPETLLQWTPMASIYLLDAADVPLRHRFRQHLALDIGSFVLAGGAGWVMRRVSEGIPRFGLKPGTQFPSGHATNAFRGAELFRQEWKGRSPWVSWSGYVMASWVSYLRMRHGQHQLSEVIAGAGLGVLSTRSVYWLKERLEARSMRKR